VPGTSSVRGDDSGVASGVVAAMGFGANVGAGCGAEERPAIQIKMAVIAPMPRATSNSTRNIVNFLGCAPPASPGTSADNAGVDVAGCLVAVVNCVSSADEARASNPRIDCTSRA